jgi:hypothetical protein
MAAGRRVPRYAPRPQQPGIPWAESDSLKDTTRGRPTALSRFGRPRSGFRVGTRPARTWSCNGQTPHQNSEKSGMPSVRGEMDWPPKASRSEITMTIPTFIVANACRCSQCGYRIRNAVFCQLCNASLCSWECYQHHLKSHTRVPSRAAINCTILGGTGAPDCSSEVPGGPRPYP